MTNLTSKKKKRRLITPENSLLFTPLILGIITFSFLIIFILRPLMGRLSNEETKIRLLEEKISMIPLYQKYIKDISQITDKASKQQKRLIEIISDPNELKAILSEINRICIKYKINIVDIIPEQIVKYEMIDKAVNNENLNAESNKIVDPLLIASLEKHIFKIKINGTYGNLIDFLKELETLQTIVISDNIEINYSQKISSNMSQTSQPNLEMKFNLSTYAKIDKNK